MPKILRNAVLLRKKSCGTPIAGKELLFSKNDRFKELLALLDFEKSDSQNKLIYNFHAFKNPHRTSQILFRGGSGVKKNNIFWLGSLWVNFAITSGPLRNDFA